MKWRAQPNCVWRATFPFHQQLDQNASYPNAHFGDSNVNNSPHLTWFTLVRTDKREKLNWTCHHEKKKSTFPHKMLEMGYSYTKRNNDQYKKWCELNPFAQNRILDLINNLNADIPSFGVWNVLSRRSIQKKKQHTQGKYEIYDLHLHFWLQATYFRNNAILSDISQFEFQHHPYCLGNRFKKSVPVIFKDKKFTWENCNFQFLLLETKWELEKFVRLGF